MAAYDDLKIRDLSRLSGAWTPPISAMGGPPAHQLYSDLVAFAGLQLFRDTKTRPWVVLRDGAQRRAFLAPSGELRSAIDRFRMRRNVRPLSESTIDEFVRIVQARISDPDVQIPILRSPLAEQEPTPEGSAPAPPEPEEIGDRWKHLDEEIDSALRDLDALDHPAAAAEAPAPREEPTELVEAQPEARIDPSISGARALPAPKGAGYDRYVRVLRRLVEGGGWMGTTQELSRLTRTDPITLFDSLLRYRTDLAGEDILITNIEVEGSYRWLAVDRTRIRGTNEAPAPENRPMPAE